MRLHPVVAGLSFALAACAAPVGDSAEPSETAKHSIVGGTPSPASQDATVLVSEAGSATCTGVLIAPNLVLTARHCVTYYDAASECGAPLRGEVPTSLITISVGVHASPHAPAARATRFFVPAAPDLCGDDIALIALDDDVNAVSPAKIRFSPLAVDELATALGYGTQGSGRHQRSDVKVLAVGPASARYRTSAGYDLPMNVPANEVATTESTCYGDSGGPLLDTLGQVVAVASRGLDELCVDRPTLWTTLGAHEAMIRNAAATVGHPLAEATVPSRRTGTTSAASGSADSTSDDDDDDDRSAARTNANDRGRGRSGGVASAGCTSAARTGAGAGADLDAPLGIVLSLGLIACRRRARPRLAARSPSS